MPWLNVALVLCMKMEKDYQNCEEATRFFLESGLVEFNGVSLNFFVYTAYAMKAEIYLNYTTNYKF